MSIITKPLLAGKAGDPSSFNYPIYATPKLDGIRCLRIDGEIVSRSFKPIQNAHIRGGLKSFLPENIDGEIMAGDDYSKFGEVSGAVMRRSGTPKFTYFAFDWVSGALDEPYVARMAKLAKWYLDDCPTEHKDSIEIVLPLRINNEEDLLNYEEICLAQGYEGVIIRDGRGPYKCGRSTAKQGILLKLKRWSDSEAKIVGFEEKLHNENEATKDAFGRTERSTSKEGLIPAGTLGALIVRDINTNIEFNVGTGFDDTTRQEMWDNREDYLGRLAKYKSFKIGVKTAPRFPVFLGMRHIDDM